MFQPPVFREDRPEVMQALMRAHPFATLVSAATGPLTAEHVPLVLHEGEGARGVLRGHLGAGNPLFRETEGRIEVLTIFQGPQAYVMPSWYASKREHGKVVPTWNYVVVHARGRLRFTRETYWLLRHLQDLTAQQEGQRPQPWAVTDAPEDFVMRQLRGLVGFEIEIEELAGTWKVSQNKESTDRQGVEAGLGAQESAEEQAVAALVRERARV
ncbi:FMN-binding negative transcriptional regulator [Sulfitobacter aestuarii]|uniref:FMN-binding negative transcriptional regulator n=1 Tax=Sulfitobacter aestuarii TaxID=2161676 RepID=A0ABW5U710_9RHOB